MKIRKFGIALILLVPIGLVVGPVLGAGMRSEIAHWYIAAAANALELGKGDVDKSLQLAREWDPDVSRLQDYWSVRLRQLKSSSDVALADVLSEVPEERKEEIADRLASQFGSKGDFALAAEVMRNLLGDKAIQSIIYWDVMISQSLEEEGEAQAVQTLRAAIEANPENSTLRRVLAQEFALILSSREDFAATLEAYKLWFGEKYDRDTTTLNAMAYGRALARVELEQALTDINEALGYRPDDPDLRDTRAWVYYQMGRYEEALADADFAVRAKESPSIASWSQRLLDWLQTAAASTETRAPVKQPTSPDAKPAPEAEPEQISETETQDGAPPVVKLDAPDNYLTPSTTTIGMWSRGVVRYHRAKILEKLGRLEEAEADWKWIEENRLPPDDRLH